MSKCEICFPLLTWRKEARNKRKQFSIDRKSLYASGNKVTPPKNGFPLISVNCFHWTEYASPQHGLEDSFKNTFPLDRKQLSLEGVSKKWEKIISKSQKIRFHKQEFPLPNFKSFNKALKKNTLSTARKSVSTSRNEEFVKKYVSP